MPPSLRAARAPGCPNCDADESRATVTSECDRVCTACGLVLAFEPISPTSRGLPFSEEPRTGAGVFLDFVGAKRSHVDGDSSYHLAKMARVQAATAVDPLDALVFGNERAAAEVVAEIRPTLRTEVYRIGGTDADEAAAAANVFDWMARAHADEGPVRKADARMAVAASCAISVWPWESSCAVVLGSSTEEILRVLDARKWLQEVAEDVYLSIRPASARGAANTSSIRDAIDQVLDRRTSARASGASRVVASVAFTFAVEMRRLAAAAREAHAGAPVRSPFAFLDRREMMRRNIEREACRRACESTASSVAEATSSVVGTNPDAARETLAVGMAVAAAVVAREFGIDASVILARKALERLSDTDVDRFSPESMLPLFDKTRERCSRAAQASTRSVLGDVAKVAAAFVQTARVGKRRRESRPASE